MKHPLQFAVWRVYKNKKYCKFSSACSRRGTIINIRLQNDDGGIDDDDNGDDYDNGNSYDDDGDDEVETPTLAHRWQHRHHKHWPPQCQAGRTSLGRWL